MSLSSRESNLAQYREALLQLNSEFMLMLSERRAVCLKIQELKNSSGRYAHYDPEREKLLFKNAQSEFKPLSLKELLAFSLIMEDQAVALAPGSYPNWSNQTHLLEPIKELYGMINPLLLKYVRPDLFSHLQFSLDFSFLKEF